MKIQYAKTIDKEQYFFLTQNNQDFSLEILAMLSLIKYTMNAWNHIYGKLFLMFLDLKSHF